MKPSIIMSNAVIIITLLLVSFMFVAAAHGEEAQHQVYVTFASHDVPATVQPYLVGSDYEWVSETTISVMLTTPQIDDLHGYAEVVSTSDSNPVAEPHLYRVYLSAIQH